MKIRDFLAVFNRGLISRRALARVDVTRAALSAETQTNWMPRVLGSMMLRCGTEYLGNFKSDAQGVYIPFIFTPTDTAMLEMTPEVMRIWDEGEDLVTREAVSASITNGAFTTDLAGWVAEAQVECGNDDALAGIVIAKRRGTTNVGRWYVHMTVDELIAIITGQAADL